MLKLKVAHLPALPVLPVLQVHQVLQALQVLPALQVPQAQKNLVNGDNLHGRTLRNQPREIQDQLLHGILILLNNGIPTQTLGNHHGEIQLLHQLPQLGMTPINGLNQLLKLGMTLTNGLNQHL